MKPKKNPFKKSHIFITGGASGIGRQLCKDFYFKEHAHLTILDRDIKGLQTLKQDLEALSSRSHRGQKINLVHCDLSSKAALNKALSKTENAPIDILINNAGITYSGLFEDTEIEDFEKVININLMATIRLTKALLPKILKSKRGRIVNIASLGGLIGMPGMSAYSTSKFGVIGFSEALHLELKGRVTVCTICPAFVKTQIANNALLGAVSKGKSSNSRVENMNKILTKLGSNPQKASQTIIQAIKDKKKMTLINPDAHVLYYLKRFLPFFSDSLIYQAFKKLTNQGIFRS